MQVQVHGLFGLVVLAAIFWAIIQTLQSGTTTRSKVF